MTRTFPLSQSPKARKRFLVYRVVRVSQRDIKRVEESFACLRKRDAVFLSVQSIFFIVPLEHRLHQEDYISLVKVGELAGLEPKRNNTLASGFKINLLTLLNQPQSPNGWRVYQSLTHLLAG